MLEGAFTTFGWLYVLATGLQVLVSLVAWYFNLSHLAQELLIVGNISDTVRVVLTTWVVAALWLSIMFLWGYYNLKKFGPLNRRKFPKAVTQEEISLYFRLPLPVIQEMQNSKLITLEKTIV